MNSENLDPLGSVRQSLFVAFAVTMFGGWGATTAPPPPPPAIISAVVGRPSARCTVA
jgi:hypothetical protein